MTECAECGLEPEWGGWEPECARVRSEREAVWGTLRLCGRRLLGIFWQCRMPRKRISGLAHALVLLRCLPIVKG